MQLLKGRAVGDTIIEITGPILGRNHFNTTVAPRIIVTVVGTGSVKLQQTTTYENVSAVGGPNPVSFEKRGTGWADVGTTASGGTPATVAITANNYWIAVRAVVVTEGEGYVLIETQWV